MYTLVPYLIILILKNIKELFLMQLRHRVFVLIMDILAFCFQAVCQIEDRLF